MNSQAVDNSQYDNPRLECDGGADGAPECTALQEKPLLIGRSEKADVRVVSGRVSREHAVIEQEDGRWRIRDLDSTNGTFVNGQRLTAAVLHNNDVITIADTTFTFRAAEASADGGATQTVLMSAGSQGVTVPAAEDWIDEVRRLQEAVLHCGFIVRLNPVIPLDGDVVFGHRGEIVAGGPLEPHEAFAGLRATPCRLARSYASSARVAALQKITASGAHGRLVLAVDPAEADDQSALGSHVEWLRFHAPSTITLVLELPASACEDQALIAMIVELAAAHQIEVCYGGFSGGKAEARQLGELRPQYVLLDDETVRRGHQGDQARKQISQLVGVFREFGCEPIIPAVWNEQNRTLLRDLGFRYVLKTRETGA